jgi:NAD-dependent SIR2 family protein deacetylase
MMTPLDFQLRFKARAPQLMWLLGAGASASAGIKTAWHMIWEFKRIIYGLEKKVADSRIPTLLDDSTRALIQSVLDQTKRYPVSETVEEYSAYFESARPSQSDRRAYIQEQVRQGQPSRGHFGLTALLSTGHTKLIWTTNFDRMVEQAYAELKRFNLTGNDLLTVSLDNADEARRGLNESNYPMLVKLHGDYQSVRLMNTTEELRAQDAQMRSALTRACGQFGLIVVGYSGRDDSVMDALDEALNDSQSFPQGIFWIVRSGTVPLPRVAQFIEKAKSQGIEADFVEIETFDELVSDLIGLESADFPPALNDYLQQLQPPVRDAPIPAPAPNTTWPLLRMNALRISHFPKTCRLIPVGNLIDGDRAVQQLINQGNYQIIARRFKEGIIAFGADEDLTNAFASCMAGGFDYYPFQRINSPSSYESQEHRLVLDALAQALMQGGGLRLERRFGSPLLVADEHEAPERFSVLRKSLSTSSVDAPLSGISNGYTWHEALELHVEFRLDRLWLVVVPTLWIDSPEPDSDSLLSDFTTVAISPEYAAVREFTRQRLRNRYNAGWNAAITGWVNVLLGANTSKTFKTFDLHRDGSDAVFTIEKDTAHSRRTA